MSLSFSLISCDRFLKGSPSPALSPVKIRPQEFSCLTNWADDVNKYFRDELNENQTRAVFTCLDGAITIFQNFAGSQNPSEFSDQELMKFLNRYLMENRKMTTGFLSELMKLKVFLLGGQNNAFTKNEIQKFHDTIQTFSNEAVQLRGYWKILLLAKDRGQVKTEDLNTAHSLAKSSILRVISQSQAINSNYSFADLRNLIDETSNFIKGESAISNMKKWLSLADSIRQLFIGDSSTIYSQNDWFSLARWSTDAYFWMLSYYYHMIDIDTNLGESWRQIFSFLDMGLNLIEASPQMQKENILPVLGIDRVIDEVLKIQNVKLENNFLIKISAPTLKETYRHILASMIQNKRLGPSAWKSVMGLERQDVEVIRAEYNVWKYSQAGLLILFGKNRIVTFDSLVKVAPQVKPESILVTGAFGAQKADTQLLTSWHEFLSLTNTAHPLAFDTRQRLTISTFATGKTTSLNSMSLLNGLRTLVRLVLTGYGVQRDQNPWNAIMTEPSFINWETDFRKFGVEIHFLDRRESGAGSSAHRDAKFFTFSGQGNDNVSSTQMMELLSMMISGGMGSADEVMKLLEVNKCNTNKLDLGIDRPIANEDCFNKVIRENFLTVFSNLPALTREIREGRLSVDQIIDLGKIIAYRKEHTPGLFEYTEVRQLSGVLHYLESLIEVYDQNRNQTFSLQEISQAFPRFESKIIEFSPMHSFMSQEAFLYVVYRGYVPKVNSVASGIVTGLDFNSFVMDLNNCSNNFSLFPCNLGTVSRVNLLKVISVLKK